MRVFRRPMFRRGGSTNQGIMTGLVDRRRYSEGPSKEEILAKRYEKILGKPDINQLLIQGGLGLVSGQGTGQGVLADVASAFKGPTDKYFQQAMANKLAAKKLGIEKATPKDTRPPLQKLAESMGLKVGTPEYNKFIERSSFKTEAAASGLQQKGQVVSKPARDKVVKDLNYVKNIRRQADLIRDKIKEDPTLTGGVGTLRRGGNQIGTLLKDLGIDVGKILPEGVTKDFIFDPDIPTIAALENTLAAGYAKVLYPGQKITNLQINQAKKIVNLTGLRGSEEVAARINQIAKEMDVFINANESLLGIEKKDTIPKYSIVNGELERID